MSEIKNKIERERGFNGSDWLIALSKAWNAGQLIPADDAEALRRALAPFKGKPAPAEVIQAADHDHDVNDEMLAEEFRRGGLRVQSMHSFRCNSLDFMFAGDLGHRR